MAPSVDYLHNQPSRGDLKLRLPSLRTVARNGFLLLVPIMLWDSAFTGSLPAVYGNPADFQAAYPDVATAETVLRTIVIILPALMPITIRSDRQRIGVIVYALGVVTYFASWLVVMAWPLSQWSLSAIGFLAPAYLAYPWLVGIGLMSDRLYVRSPYRWWQYVVLATTFAVVHVAHFVPYV